MALNIKKVSAYDIGNQMIALTKVDPGIVQSLADNNYGLKVTEDQFQFWYKGDPADGDETMLDSVKFSDFTQLKEGKLSAGVMHALSTLLTNKINSILGNQNSALAMLPKKTLKAKIEEVAAKKLPKADTSVYGGDDDEDEVEHDEDEIPSHKKTKVAKPGKGHNPQAMSVAGDMWPMFEADITTAPRVKLIKAAKMYQPVSASSGGSRYFLIAGCDEIKMACRYQDANISIRVEGDQLADYHGALKMCGFTNHGGYSSVHLKPTTEDPTMPFKTIGAILFALAAPWRTPVPDIEFIRGKGQ